MVSSLSGRWRTCVLLLALVVASVPLQLSGVGRAAEPDYVGVAAGDTGHWTVRADGTVMAHDGAPRLGDLGGRRLSRPIVDMAATPTGDGYWLVASDGGIFSFGDARFHGSTGALRLNQPVVGMAPTPTGKGYWLVATDGGIFSFGDARFHGSTGAKRLNQPVVGMATSPTGRGYWLVAADGGIFTFGDARFSGSTGGKRLNEPVIGMAASESGKGYWLVASDGGVFSFGDASFYGAASATPSTTVRGLTPRRAGGYLLVAAGGAVLAFGPGVSPVADTSRPAVVPAPAPPGTPAPLPPPSSTTAPPTTGGGGGGGGGTTAPPPSTTNPPTTPAPPTTNPPPATVTPGVQDNPSVPFNAVRLRPGDHIQGAVDRNPAGTAFVLTAGVYRRQTINPKSGNTFIGERGAVLTGEGVTGKSFIGGSNDVTIRNLVVENYVPGQQQAMLDPHPGQRWVVEHNEIRGSNGAGTHCPTGGRYRYNWIHHNQQFGITSTDTTGCLIEGNDVSYNNPQNAVDYLWAAGGSKFVRTTGLVVRGNVVHHNVGPGLWTDINNVNTLYEGNHTFENGMAGIFHEISYAAVIRNNRSENNGHFGGRHGADYGAGILVSSSRDVEVYGNELSGNTAGIRVIQDNRGNGSLGPWQTSNLNVHDNVIALGIGRNGFSQSVGDKGYFTSRNNRFAANTYSDVRSGSPFLWDDRNLDRNGWQSYGQDTGGTWR